MSKMNDLSIKISADSQKFVSGMKQVQKATTDTAKIAETNAAKTQEAEKVTLKMLQEREQAEKQLGYEAKKTFESTRTSAERYQAQVKSLKEQLDAGKISQDTFNRAMDEAEKSVKKTGGVVGGFKDHVKSLITPTNLAIAAIGALVIGGKAAYVAFQTLDIATKSLDLTLENLGRGGTDMARVFSKLRAETGATMLEMTTAFDTMLQASGDMKQAEEDLILVLDASAKSNKSVEDTTLAIIEARTGSITGLRRLNLLTAEEAKNLEGVKDAGERTALALDLIREKSAGASAAVSENDQALRDSKAAWDDLTGFVGGAISAMTDLAMWAGTVSGVFNVLGQSFQGLRLGSDLIMGRNTDWLYARNGVVELGNGLAGLAGSIGDVDSAMAEMSSTEKLRILSGELYALQTEIEDLESQKKEFDESLHRYDIKRAGPEAENKRIDSRIEKLKHEMNLRQARAAAIMEEEKDRKVREVERAGESPAQKKAREARERHEQEAEEAKIRAEQERNANIARQKKAEEDALYERKKALEAQIALMKSIDESTKLVIKFDYDYERISRNIADDSERKLALQLLELQYAEDITELEAKAAENAKKAAEENTKAILARAIGINKEVEEGKNRRLKDRKDIEIPPEVKTFADDLKRLLETPQEKFNKQLEDMNKALKANVITIVEMKQGTALFREEMEKAVQAQKEATDEFQALSQVGDAAAQSIVGSFQDLLFDPMNASFKDMVSNFAEAVGKMAIEVAILQALKSAAGAMSGGASDTIVGALPFASGGYVSGPGTGTSDSINARLSNGEFVQRAAAVSHYGADFMDDLNNMRIPKSRRFADGGLVTSGTLPSGGTQSTAAPASSQITIANIMPEDAETFFQSRAGGELFVNMLEKNKRTIKNL